MHSEFFLSWEMKYSDCSKNEDFLHIALFAVL